MPLVTCPECGGSVSTAATSCPHCGHPMDPPARLVPALAEVTPERELCQGTPSAKALLGAIAGAALFSIAVCLAVYFAYRPLITLLAGMSPDLGQDLELHRDTV